MNNRSSDILIAGGGIAAIFTAYEILKKAREKGNDFRLAILADKISVPCPAGSHIVLELEGMYDAQNEGKYPELPRLLSEGMNGLTKTILDENIACRLSKKYEVKAKNKADLSKALEDMARNNVARENEFVDNSDNQIFHLKDHNFSAVSHDIGQVNALELAQALIEKIKNMGGKVIEGVRFKSCELSQGGYIVDTDDGKYFSALRPILATGAEHLCSLPDLSVEAKVVHTMCLTYGPLSSDNAKTISAGPVAMCNADLAGDVLWGGIDEKNYLTIGRGHLVNPALEDELQLETEISELVQDWFPAIRQYPYRKSFGAMMVTHNRLPVVKRLGKYCVMSGWAGMGIVASYAAAISFADWIIDSNDSKLKLFESLQS